MSTADVTANTEQVSKEQSSVATISSKPTAIISATQTAPHPTDSKTDDASTVLTSETLTYEDTTTTSINTVSKPTTAATTAHLTFSATSTASTLPAATTQLATHTMLSMFQTLIGLNTTQHIFDTTTETSAEVSSTVRPSAQLLTLLAETSTHQATPASAPRLTTIIPTTTVVVPYGMYVT